MKVLHVIVSLERAGGAEMSLHRLITHDEDDDHVVVSLRALPAGRHVLHDTAARCLSLGLRSARPTLGSLRHLIRLIREERPDVVQSWMYHADLFAGVASALAPSTGLCWGVHHFNLERHANKRATLWVARACAGLSWFLPDRIVYCAERGAEAHEAFGYARGKRAVIPNGYDLESFYPSESSRAAWRERWGVADNVLLLGCVARWHPQKDHANLVAALAILRARTDASFYCVLIGRGMDLDNNALGELLDAAGLRDCVVLSGAQQDVTGIMSALDLHVLPSRGEAFPNVVAEAMACRTPCVVTDVGDAAKIVGDSGWVVPPGDPEALAAALGEALLEMTGETPDGTFEQRGKAARTHIESHFSIERIVSMYRDVWQSVART